MGKVAQWEFGDDTVFNGFSDYAEIASSGVMKRDAGRLVISVTPNRLAEMTLAARGPKGSEPGAFRLGLSEAGAVTLRFARAGAEMDQVTSPDGLACPGEALDISLSWGAVGQPNRLKAQRADGCGPIADLALPGAVSLGHGGHFPLVVGATAAGEAPFFHGMVHRVTLWDAPEGRRKMTTRDVLDLSGQGAFQVQFPGDDGSPGYVDFPKADGAGTDRVAVGDFARVVPSFAFGTYVSLLDSQRRVELLRTGDMVLTRDQGLQPLRWVGHSTLDWDTLRTSPHLRPILIRRGALGDDLPTRDMQVSPNHRLWVRGDRSRLDVNAPEALIAAKHLVNHRGIYEVDALGVTYVRLMFDRQQTVRINGVWAESFQPGQPNGNAQRTELLELFPGLKRPRGGSFYD
ncbi:MAG: Hint domain-containing protein [Pseudomonadota bacterium]